MARARSPLPRPSPDGRGREHPSPARRRTVGGAAYQALFVVDRSYETEIGVPALFLSS